MKKFSSQEIGIAVLTLVGAFGLKLAVDFVFFNRSVHPFYYLILLGGFCSAFWLLRERNINPN